MYTVPRLGRMQTISMLNALLKAAANTKSPILIHSTPFWQVNKMEVIKILFDYQMLTQKY